MSALEIQYQDGVCTISLNRPDVRNAFDDKLIDELTNAFSNLNPRIVVLRGAGKVFCAGGDLEWMKRSIDLSEEENLEDAKALGAMFKAIDEAPCPVIARVQGAAFGGGLGLVCACDIVVAAEDTKFCFSEAKLGLAPAVIAPYAIRKIGETQARRYFQTAEVFDAEEARRIGLVHEVTTEEELDNKISAIVESILSNGSNAVTAAKSLIRQITTTDSHDASDICAKTIASLRVSEEGQEGVRAFLEKRKPKWAN